MGRRDTRQKNQVDKVKKKDLTRNRRSSMDQKIDGFLVLHLTLDTLLTIARKDEKREGTHETEEIGGLAKPKQKRMEGVGAARKLSNMVDCEEKNNRAEHMGGT